MRLAALAWVLLLTIGATGASLELTSQEGAPVRLSLEPGESAVIAHFWATWCRSCTEELPALARAAAECADDGVRVVTVNVGEDEETIASYRAKHEFGLPILRDPKGKVWRGFARGLPVNVFLTSAGQRTDFGPRSEADWRRELAALGCEAGAPETTLP
ncbi:MAG: TlpA family protein disulfide reductase [Myxococcales bacterium]|nr:TlpA family protein disulfide reductase [Myxococcales bacterium]